MAPFVQNSVLARSCAFAYSHVAEMTCEYASTATRNCECKYRRTRMLPCGDRRSRRRAGFGLGSLARPLLMPALSEPLVVLASNEARQTGAPPCSRLVLAVRPSPAPAARWPLCPFAVSAAVPPTHTHSHPTPTPPPDR